MSAPPGCTQADLASCAALCCAAQDKEAVGACWLQRAKMCRAAGHYEAAETAALEAVAQGVPGAVLQVG
jgi:hypothetical protein